MKVAFKAGRALDRVVVGTWTEAEFEIKLVELVVVEIFVFDMAGVSPFIKKLIFLLNDLMNPKTLIGFETW